MNARTAVRALLAAAALALAAAGAALAQAPPAVSTYWKTRAEKTNYRQTADYDETVRYAKQIEAGSRWVSVQSFGKSGQGRDLWLVVLSKERAFTPAAARATRKPIVLVNCGIHSGEIEGKDAALALMRDVAATRSRAELLDSAIVLVVPILSVDAHERRGRFNRINQNGPEEMGWRTTPTGLNLNRDWLKGESPEMRALLANVYTKWWPHLLIDTHTTDGADYRYDLTYGIQHGAGVPAAIDRWMADAFEGRVVARAEALGHLVGPYMSFRRGNDPASGIDFGNAPPRFSTAYPVLHNRPAILVETHMLKPYDVRVRATYDLLLAVLEELRARPRALTRAVSEAAEETIARGREASPAKREFALATRTTDRPTSYVFHGVRTRWETSRITGDLVARYDSVAWDTTIALYRQTVPALTVRAPVGYVVPQEWSVARDRLDLHGVAYRRFAKAWTDTVEQQRVVRFHHENTSREGHVPTVVDSLVSVRRVRTFRAGDLWVPLDQPSAAVAIHSFEAEAPDGILYWNGFDTVLEQKEYGEDYVVDPLAQQMLAKDPALAREFAERLKDPAFAANPFARTNFFYTRTAWADAEQNLLPVCRAQRRPPETALAP